MSGGTAAGWTLISFAIVRFQVRGTRKWPSVPLNLGVSITLQNHSTAEPAYRRLQVNKNFCLLLQKSNQVLF